MDSIIDLHVYHGYTIIMVIIGRFSKSSHCRMLPTKFTAFKAAELFTNIFCKHHGYLRASFLIECLRGFKQILEGFVSVK